MPRERIPDVGEAAQRALFGPMDRNLRAVRERFGVRITARHEVLTLEGPDDEAVQAVARRVRRALSRLARGGTPREEEIGDLLLGDGVFEAGGKRPPAPRGARGERRTRPRVRPAGPRDGPVPAAPRPRTPGQEHYVQAIRAHDVVVAVGPAGTGKTYLAVVEAVAALRSGQVNRIVLTRPAVEAGEKLGFLPGDFHAKINPYLRPLYDALGELIPWGEVQRYMDADVIEIVPLAYMRGRTLKGAFIILDEGQNTTPAQMKMFLTRLGDGSKIVVNGDITQVDLPESVPSGLVESLRILEGVDGVSVIRFGPEDIQRHPLVERIVDSYDRDETRRAQATGGSEGA
jgi:phosphate starvation-inducible PhoH-like protein